VPLPLAYRSLPRPSSPPCAQASPTCLHSLDYNSTKRCRRLQSLAIHTHSRVSASPQPSAAQAKRLQIFPSDDRPFSDPHPLAAYAMHATLHYRVSIISVYTPIVLMTMPSTVTEDSSPPTAQPTPTRQQRARRNAATNKDSQIRDLPLLPLSISSDAQSSRAGP
jgi:hypothetical protein